MRCRVCRSLSCVVPCTIVSLSVITGPQPLSQRPDHGTTSTSTWSVGQSVSQCVVGSEHMCYINALSLCRMTPSICLGEVCMTGSHLRGTSLHMFDASSLFSPSSLQSSSIHSPISIPPPAPHPSSGYSMPTLSVTVVMEMVILCYQRGQVLSCFCLCWQQF